MSGSLDTNIVLRLLLGDIPEQAARARQLLDTHRSLSVADIVFVEIEYALRMHYKLNREQIAQLIKSLSVLPVITCNRPLLARALATYQDRPALSFTDICLDAYAGLTPDAAPLYTFDKKLASQAPHTKNAMV